MRIEDIAFEGYIFFEDLSKVFHEMIIRNINDGTVYSVLFNRNRKGCFFFYSYEENLWTGYAIKKMDEYMPLSVWNTEKILSLRDKIKNGEIKVERRCGANFKGYHYFKDFRGEIHIPEPSMLPFFFENELDRLPNDEKIQRFNYTAPPKYLVFCRKTYFYDDRTRASWEIFGSNKQSFYNAIEQGTTIEVAKLCSKTKAVVKYKLENTHGIIPKFNCVGISKQ